MVSRLIRWSLENRLAVLALALGVLLSGTWVGLSMPVDVFPDLTAPTVTVLVEGHGMPPEDMEARVTFPIEAAVNGAEGVRRVRSGTALGIAVVWVEFEWGTDVHRARQTVNERLATLAGTLPEEVEPPQLAPTSSIMGEILFVSLTSDRHSLLELRTTAVQNVRRRLLSVPGVSQVTPIGGDTAQLQVRLAPERLAAHGIPAAEVVTALERASENVAGGVLVRGADELVIEGLGRVRTPGDVEATLVRLVDGVPVTVGDLGRVELGAALKRGTACSSRRGPDWEPILADGVVLAIQKQPGANTLELTRKVEEVLDALAAELPAGMWLEKNLFRQATFIEHALANTTTALLEGAAMVVLVVLAFLASTRASAVTLVALPLSLATAVLVLRGLGGTINTMTLGGMAIAIGALVDDAIIDVENVVRRLRENAALPSGARRPPLSVVLSASLEVRPSIVLATLLILLVFTPLFFLDGIEGRLLRPLGVAFTVSLAASLLTALTVTPALCLLCLPTSATVAGGAEPALVRACKRLYARPLEWSLDRPRTVGLAGLAFLIGALVHGSTFGRNFLPEFNEGALVVGLVTLPGTSLAESDRLAHLVEQELMRHPEIVAIGRRTGRAEGDEHVQGVEASEIDLTLDMEAPERLGLPVRTKAELLEALRASVARVPGIQATFGQPISHRIDHMLSGTRASVAVKLFGDDLAVLRAQAARVEGLMGAVPGIVDLARETQELVPALRVELDRAALARHGLAVADAALALELATIGTVAGQVRQGTSTLDLVVRTGTAAELSEELLAATRVPTPGGALVPLRALATLSEERTPNFVSREDVQRKIAVTCNVAGRDVAGVVADVQAALAADGGLPPGYRVEYGGQFESAAETGRLLTVLGAGVVVAIAGLLYFLFRSLRDTALVLLNLPLALAGGVLGVALTGGTLTVASLIGFITVFGVAARNGIMLVSHIRHLQQHEGERDFRAAVRRGALERLCPILMTALAAGLALVPLALRGEEPGNEILTPMAVVILAGLLSATLLNVLLVPAMYIRHGRPLAATRPDDAEVRHA
ncbi:MAG TPA: efflux RND transporter permease subunit [Planctomycetota bacterium]